MSDPPDAEIKIVGAYYRSAYGPSILLKLGSPSAAEWLRDLLQHVGGGESGVRLDRQPGVMIRDIKGLELRSDTSASSCSLSDPNADTYFVWTCNPSGWERLSWLLGPFVEGRSGHQYLTSEGIDAALVEVSHAEPDVGAE